MYKALLSAAALAVSIPAQAQIPPWCYRNTTTMTACAAALNAQADEQDRRRGIYVPPGGTMQAQQPRSLSCRTYYIGDTAYTDCN